MKKKLLSAIMAISMSAICAFGFTACGESGESAEKWGDVYTVAAAYAQAKELGYEGTLDEFIASISGKDGIGITETLINSDGELIIVFSNGTTQNLGKVTGKDGLSAFEIYKKYHPEYTGTEQEWIESLKGTAGVGVKTAYLNDEGDLIVEFTDGSTVNCGNIASAFYRLQYKAVEEDGEVIGYSVAGIGTVIDMDVIIPSTYKGKPVISIGSEAFVMCRSITSITIPEGVTFIDSYAFDSCSKLARIVIPKSVISIAEYAIYGCRADIYFNGTQEQWNEIEKDNSWNSADNYTIHCTDGDIVKN